MLSVGLGFLFSVKQEADIRWSFRAALAPSVLQESDEGVPQLARVLPSPPRNGALDL